MKFVRKMSTEEIRVLQSGKCNIAEEIKKSVCRHTSSQNYQQSLSFNPYDENIFCEECGEIFTKKAFSEKDNNLLFKSVRIVKDHINTLKMSQHFLDDSNKEDFDTLTKLLLELSKFEKMWMDINKDKYICSSPQGLYGSLSPYPNILPASNIGMRESAQEDIHPSADF